MTLFIPPFARATDANSDSLSGALLYFYATGTTTPVSVYTTAALSTAHANPVVADAGGKFAAIYLDPSVTYRAVLRTSGGSELFDIDPYNSATTASGVSVLSLGVTGDGSTDDTDALHAAFALLDRVHIPAGTYAITNLEIPANKVITTDGLGTIFDQIPGQSTTEAIITVVGSNVEIGSFTVRGNIATDTGEFMHGIQVEANETTGNISNVTLGDVHGEDIRGDVVLLNSLDGDEVVANVRMGQISGANVLRNVVAIVGAVEGVDIVSATGTQVGYAHFLVESDIGAGITKGVRIGYVKGNYAAIVCPTAADYADAIEIGTLDLDQDGHGCTPAYAASASLAGNAFQVRNCKSVRIGKFRAEDFNAQALLQVYNSGELAEQNVWIGHAEIIDCCKTEATFLSYIQGTPGVTRIAIEHLSATTTLATHRVINQCDAATVGFADITLVAGSKYMANCIDSVTHIGNIAGGTVFQSCTDCHIEGGAQSGEWTFNSSTRCSARNCTITASTAVDASGTNNRILDSVVGGTYYRRWENSAGLIVDNNGKVTSYDGIRSRSATAGIGYDTGAGGTVTQATSKSTGVTLNKAAGQITMHNAALAAATSVSFTLTNSAIAAGDVLIVNIASGATADAYTVDVTAVASGSARIQLRNESAGSLGEAVVLNFTVLKGATS